MKQIKLFEMFAGYGGGSFALKKANIPFECVGFSEIDKYAVQCYEQNHQGKNYGDCTKIDPKELPDFDLLTGGFPCILEGTLITTKRGQIPIENVVIGDEVLTHNNVFKKVTNTMSRYRNHYYNVKFEGSPYLKITGNHKVYCRKMIRIFNENTRCCDRFFSKPEWISINEIRTDDFIGFGTWSNKHSTNEKELTNDECWLLGRYVADGYIQNNKRKGRKKSYNHKIVFCVGKSKKEEFLNMTKHCGYKIGYSEERTVFKFRIINERFMKLCLECGKGAKNKKIPFWILNLPTNKLESFLEGYISGDGCFTNNSYCATSISKILIYQLGQVVHRLYKTPYSINYTKKPKTTIIEGRTVNQNDTWSIRFKKEKRKQDNGVWIKNNVWGRFVSKEKILGKIKTYNLTVDTHHSYVANNVIVKNCQSFSMAGKREGFKSKETGNLFFEICRIAKVKQPQYMVLENVKGILSHDNGETHNIIVRELKKIGYGVAWKCLNSKDYGIPQNRERVFYVCKLGGWDFMEFEFPYKEKLTITIKDILEDNVDDNVDDKYYLTEKQKQRITENTRFRDNMCIKKDISSTLCVRDYKDGGKRVQVGDYRYDEGLRIRKDGNSPCLFATMGASKSSLSNSIIVHSLQSRSVDRPSLQKNPQSGGSGHLCKNDGTSYCLDTSNSQAIQTKDVWRRLTPTECFRLMGFLDDNIKLGGLSDTQKYKLAGNGWDINLVSKIFNNLFPDLVKR